MILILFLSTILDISLFFYILHLEQKIDVLDDKFLYFLYGECDSIEYYEKDSN